jgi:hypothetical protein
MLTAPMAATLSMVLLLAADQTTPQAPKTKAEPSPARVIHGFGVGARTEFFSEGVSEVIVAYDVGDLQLEGSFGGLIRGNSGPTPDDVYVATTSVIFPFHRAETTDISLGLGGGMISTFVPKAADQHRVLLLLGLRIRVFTAKNFALLGTLGSTALIGEGTFAVGFGARPLGSVGFVYYFD